MQPQQRSVIFLLLSLSCAHFNCTLFAKLNYRDGWLPLKLEQHTHSMGKPQDHMDMEDGGKAQPHLRRINLIIILSKFQLLLFLHL